MQTILRHTLDEIKRYKQRSFCPVTQMQKLNRALVEIAAETDSEMRDYLTDRYLKSLDLYHINGRAGSLLPQEAPASAPAQPDVAQVIAAANAAYDNVYAPRIPYMLAGTVEDAAAGYQALQAALVGAN